MTQLLFHAAEKLKKKWSFLFMAGIRKAEVGDFVRFYSAAAACK